MSVTLEQAIALSMDRRALLSRLKEETPFLNQAFRAAFLKGYVFDFQGKRLLSLCKTYAIQWQTRKFPDRPEAPDNQQTSVGTCVYLTINS